MEAGIDPIIYWDMTYQEIETGIKAYNKRLKRDLEVKASMDYKLADLIGVSISRLFSKDVKYPSIDKAYPNVFESLTNNDQKPKQQHWQIMKEKINAYAKNKRKRGDKK